MVKALILVDVRSHGWSLHVDERSSMGAGDNGCWLRTVPCRMGVNAASMPSGQKKHIQRRSTLRG